MSGTPPDDTVAMESRARAESRLFSPSAGRNKTAIVERLADILPPRARVLEIGSGTGEHGVEACRLRADLIWQFSDPDPASRASQDAWASELDGQAKPSIALDVMRPGWTSDAPEPDAIVCCNVIHIAPWAAAEGLASGGARLLADGARLILYGPFLDGDDTAPSNLDFDASLKARNPDWGVRKLTDVVELFDETGFALRDRFAMPANNLMLVFEKRGR